MHALRIVAPVIAAMRAAPHRRQRRSRGRPESPTPRLARLDVARSFPRVSARSSKTTSRSCLQPTGVRVTAIPLDEVGDPHAGARFVSAMHATLESKRAADHAARVDARRSRATRVVCAFQRSACRTHGSFRQTSR